MAGVLYRLTAFSPIVRFVSAFAHRVIACDGREYLTGSLSLPSSGDAIDHWPTEATGPGGTQFSCGRGGKLKNSGICFSVAPLPHLTRERQWAQLCASVVTHIAADFDAEIICVT